MVRVVAIRNFTYRQTAVHAGEAVQMEPMDAAEAAQQGKVSLDRQRPETYRRRDMVADDPRTAPRQPAAVAVSNIQTTETQAPRRRGRRRSTTK